VAVVAHRASRAQHDLRELRVGYVGAAEHGLHQLIAADRAIAVLDQETQAFEHARRQGYSFVAKPQFAGGEIEFVLPETITDDGHEYG